MILQLKTVYLVLLRSLNLMDKDVYNALNPLIGIIQLKTVYNVQQVEYIAHREETAYVLKHRHSSMVTHV